MLHAHEFAMPRSRSLLVVAVATAGILLAQPGTGRAHVRIENLESRYEGDDGKVPPCGGSEARGDRTVHEFKPGSTIQITIDETVDHPSYYRVAFDANGVDDFITPRGTAGEHGDCFGDPSCGPGKQDYCNSPAVMLDHLDLHDGDLVGTTLQTQGQTLTWTVTLPDMECDNCTIQVLQVMNDLNLHSNTGVGQAAFPGGDIYFHCIDVVLRADAPDGGAAPAQNNGMTCGSFDPAATMGSAATPDAGVASGGTNGGGTETTAGTGGVVPEATGSGSGTITTDAGTAVTGGSDGGAAPDTTGGIPGVTTGATPSAMSAGSDGCSTSPHGATGGFWLALAGLLWSYRRRIRSFS